MNIVGARVVVDHVVRFRLDDGREVDRDFALLRGPAIDPVWEDPRKFRKVKVVGGVPTWPGELDFCPDSVLRGGSKGRVPKTATVGTHGRLISNRPVRELVLRRRPRRRE